MPTHKSRMTGQERESKKIAGHCGAPSGEGGDHRRQRGRRRGFFSPDTSSRHVWRRAWRSAGSTAPWCGDSARRAPPDRRFGWCSRPAPPARRSLDAMTAGAGRSFPSWCCGSGQPWSRAPSEAATRTGSRVICTRRSRSPNTRRSADVIANAGKPTSIQDLPLAMMAWMRAKCAATSGMAAIAATASGLRSVVQRGGQPLRRRARSRHEECHGRWHLDSCTHCAALPSPPTPGERPGDATPA